MCAASTDGPTRHVRVSLVRLDLGLLTYRVPGTLDEAARPGVRVSVPLGRARAVGYLVEDDPSPPVEGVREILDVLDAEPLLSAAQLNLAQFAARYYQVPLHEVLRLLHPSGVDLVERRILGITAEGRLALERGGGLLRVQGLELEPVERAVLLGVQERPLEARRILHKVGGVDSPLLHRLVRRGLLAEIDLDYHERVKVVTETFASVEAGTAPKGAELAALARSAKVQARLLELLWEARAPMSLGELRQHVPGLRSPLGRLRERGWVRLETRERLRDPFAGQPPRPHPPPELNLDQESAVAVLSAALRAKRFEPFLLHGVTSSGKTEVYLRLIRQALDSGRGAVVLVPEISLTPQLAGRFRARFPEGVAVLHSALGSGQREDEWRRVRRGEVRLVVGARSALFAPVTDLGVIVVDEEHDSSFKQEEGVRYHARNLALVRGQQEGAVVVLGSATPSLESFHNVETGRFRLLRLPERATPQPLPTVDIVDLKRFGLDADGVLTAPLASALGEVLAAGQQAILFLNRRGFAPFVLCLSCGQPLRCHDCSVSLTLHKRRNLLVCHYCGHERRPPPICPQCQTPSLKPMGLGTERVEESLRTRFPAARIARLDRDTARGASLQRVLDATADGLVDILVGTQMVTKGHDFPGVTLVGVVNADHALHLPDFRASERTFQLLAQVAGRAGRGGTAGRVLVQTYNPDHHAIRCAQTHDYEGFYGVEARFRLELGYPPYGHLVALRIEGPEEGAVMEAAGALARRCHEAARSGTGREKVQVLGPAEAPLARLRGRARWQILLKARDRGQLQAVATAARAWRDDEGRAAPSSVPGLAKDVRVIIDVDPQSML